MPPTTQHRLFKLNDGTHLETYYGRDAHGAISHNYTHLDANMLFIQLFLHKVRYVEKLFSSIKHMI